MNPAQLLAHFDRISEAPDAVPRLRRFILDLAARGKLVEQDPNDEPASQLLKRIQAERARQLADGKLKAADALAPVDDDEVPQPLPSGWVATRLACVAACLDFMREPVNSSERDRRTAGKDPSQLFPYFGATQQQGWIDGFIFDEELVLLGEDGVPFLDPLRPKAYLISGKAWVNNHAHVFRGILVAPAFLVHWLNTFDYTGRIAGATRSKLNQSKAVDIPLLLPPLAEQHRIVAKVDELMALCDRLEAAQTERESRRDRVVAASLSRLSEPAAADGQPFRDRACFHLRHLPRLTTRPEHIQRLRQTILSLAARGRLVPQDPSDEPASELLRRIRAERQGPGEDVNKLTAPTTEHTGSVGPSVPSGWRVVKLGDLATHVTSGSRGWAAHYSSAGAIFLRIGNLDYGTTSLDLCQVQHVRPPEGAEGTRTLVEDGDILVSITGDTGMIGLVPHGLGPAYINQHIALVRPSPGLCRPYLAVFMTSPAAQAQLEAAQRGIKNSLGLDDIRQMFVPLPPLAEQHRIVAKVDELMALCARLDAQLTTAQTESRRLLEALLHQALAAVA